MGSMNHVLGGGQNPPAEIAVLDISWPVVEYHKNLIMIRRPTLDPSFKEKLKFTSIQSYHWRHWQ